jgi:hypothetical protein
MQLLGIVTGGSLLGLAAHASGTPATALSWSMDKEKPSPRPMSADGLVWSVLQNSQIREIRIIDNMDKSTAFRSNPTPKIVYNCQVIIGEEACPLVELKRIWLSSISSSTCSDPLAMQAVIGDEVHFCASFMHAPQCL